MATVITMTDEQAVVVDYSVATTMDAAGNSAGTVPSGSTVAVSVDDPSICAASADGMSVAVTSEDAPAGGSSVGQTNVRVAITLPDGSGLSDVIAVNVTPSAPTQLSGVVVSPPVAR